MKQIIQIKVFTKTLDSLIKKRQLLEDDFNEFKKELVKHPDSGDLVSGTGGVRKTRLKSASGGKSGGFRICYYHLSNKDRIFLLLIYPKNVKEDLTMEEKKTLKKIVEMLREASHG
jgi:hypothetical protein